MAMRDPHIVMRDHHIIMRDHHIIMRDPQAHIMMVVAHSKHIPRQRPPQTISPVEMTKTAQRHKQFYFITRLLVY